MKKMPKARKKMSAEAIAKMADSGKDVTPFFTGKGRMVQPIQRVNGKRLRITRTERNMIPGNFLTN